MLRLPNTDLEPLRMQGILGKRLHHVGMVVDQLETAAQGCERWLGLEHMTLPFEDATQRVRVQFVHAGGGTFLELIEPVGDGSPVGNFLLQRGGGLHHLAFEAAEFDLELDQLLRAGGRQVGRTWKGFERRRLAFIVPTGGLRLLIELVEPTKVVT